MLDQFSHYRILAKLGAGGMGVVYVAEDLPAPARRRDAFLTYRRGKI